MALIVDIETSGADFSELDSVTQEYLRGVAEKSGEEPEAKTALFPHTGEIVSLGVYDSEKNQGAVYFQGKEKDWEGKNPVQASKAELVVSGQCSSSDVSLYNLWVGCIAEAGHIELELWFLKMTVSPFFIVRVLGE